MDDDLYARAAHRAANPSRVTVPAEVVLRLYTEGTDQTDVDACHCGQPYVIHDGGPGGRYTRYLCAHCDAVRCDAYPGECGR